MIIASFIPFVGWIVNPLITLCVLYLIYHVIIGKVVTIPYFSESLEKALVQLNIRSWFE